ncbi:MAG TPA: galactitol-1-phosphate 5-dehydrogenase [Armatimonadota bacterium]|nr:galactitol-1-phosphate 5-dehydrogenase [Armatimonadota bacterium]
MKALVLVEYNTLEYKDVPDPSVGPGDVLIAVKACGICGSDVHGLDGSSGRRLPPLIMGHEAAGIIAEVGEGVTDWNTGDRVTFDSTISCGACHFCRRGATNLCDNRRVLGVSCEEYRQEGAFAEYVAVPERVLFRLPDDLSFERASMVEPFSVAVHAVNRVGPRGGESALVAGAGVIGLCLVQALRAAGCGPIIAVDLQQERLDLARRVGADCALKPEAADLMPEVMRLTGGRGVDAAFEAVGITPTLQLAIQCVRKGGAVGLVGNISPSVELPLQAAVTRELTLYGSCISRGEYADCLEMMSRGALDPEPLISATAPLAEGAAWFERLRDREPGLVKVVLTP